MGRICLTCGEFSTILERKVSGKVCPNCGSKNPRIKDKAEIKNHFQQLLDHRKV
jgi:Zn finger protein HypA/HybF involved in hydrogenase expression